MGRRLPEYRLQEKRAVRQSKTRSLLEGGSGVRAVSWGRPLRRGLRWKARPSARKREALWQEKGCGSGDLKEETVSRRKCLDQEGMEGWGLGEGACLKLGELTQGGWGLESGWSRP